MRLLRLGVGLLLACTLPTASGAIPADLDPPSLDINGWSPSDLSELGCSVNTQNQYTCSGSNLTPPSGDWTLNPVGYGSWSLFLDPDPTVVNSFAIQNNLGMTQTFVITVLLPISSIGPPVVITGSVGGSTTDTNGNGTLLETDSPNPIYRALIDGLTVQTLLNDPQTFSAGGFGTATIGPASFGPTNLAQAATSDIAITIRFELSPGDVAAFTSVFNVEAPEPGATALLGIGVVLLAWRAARRTMGSNAS